MFNATWPIIRFHAPVSAFSCPFHPGVDRDRERERERERERKKERERERERDNFIKINRKHDDTCKNTKYNVD